MASPRLVEIGLGGKPHAQVGPDDGELVEISANALFNFGVESSCLRIE